MTTPDYPVALITGAARRVGASIARQLHNDGYALALHYRSSAREAEELAEALRNAGGPPCDTFAGDLADPATPGRLVSAVSNRFGRVDLLVNNASSFYPTPVGDVSQAAWDDLFSSNARGPFFLTQALLPELERTRGCVVNIVDIHGATPMKNHPVYCMAKAALAMMTKALAKDLAPAIRVNGVSPGAVMWPEGKQMSENMKAELIKRVPLARPGDPHDIAQAVAYLASASYVTGQIVAVDGGRSLNM